MAKPSLLKKLAKSEPEKKKEDKVPEFTIPSMKATIQGFHDAKKKEKEAEADIKRLGPQLADEAARLRTEFCIENGKYVTSAKLHADGKTVTVSFSNRYSKIAPGQVGELQAIFGEDYSKYFKEKMTVEMTEEAIGDEEFIKTISEAIGEAKFAKYFKVTEMVEVTESYHEHRVTDKNLANLHEKAVDTGIVRPAAPAVKVG